GRAGGTGRTPLSCPAEPTAERPPFGAGPEIVTSALGPSPDGNRAFRFHSRWAAGLVLVPIFTNCLGRTPQGSRDMGAQPGSGVPGSLLPQDLHQGRGGVGDDPRRAQDGPPAHGIP